MLLKDCSILSAIIDQAMYNTSNLHVAAKQARVKDTSKMTQSVYKVSKYSTFI